MKEGCVTITEQNLKEMRGYAGSYELERLVRKYGKHVPVSGIFSLINYSINHPGYIYKGQRNMAINMAKLLQDKLLEKNQETPSVSTLVEQLSLPEKGNMFGILLKERVSRYEQKLAELSKEMTRELNTLKQKYETEASELEASYLAHIVTMKNKASKMKALMA
jgi:hypothetical protein